MCDVNAMLDYFEKNEDINYISFKKNEVDKYIDRLKLSYPLQEYVGRNTKGLLFSLQRIIAKLQRVIGYIGRSLMRLGLAQHIMILPILLPNGLLTSGSGGTSIIRILFAQTKCLFNH